MLKVLLDDHPAGWSSLHAADLDQQSGFAEPLGSSIQSADQPQCYCHGDRQEEEWLITDENASGSDCEWAYAFTSAKTTDGKRHDTTLALSSYTPEGKMIGYFVMSNSEAIWPVVAVVDLNGADASGALLPDLDGSESKIKHLKIPNTQIKPFTLPALVVSRSDQHRGLLHSFAGLGMMAVFFIPAAFWIVWTPVTAVLLGYFSHLMVDDSTKSGVRLLYPNPKRFHLLPTGWRFTTGSMVKETLLVPLASGSVLLLLAHSF